MGLYNFKPQFETPIRRGTKTHTIRGDRKDGWVEKPGNIMHLYTGLRTKMARMIMRVKCVKVERIKIYTLKTLPGVVLTAERFGIQIEGVLLDRSELEALARRDGFRNFYEMMKFWEGRLPFSGHIIHWKGREGKR